MMTSTFPGSRSGSSQSLKGSLQEIQSKRDALMSLEAALKRRINEFKELCLKEGEITGQLPGDYPLQPREPIPQIRRRTADRRCDSNSNLNDTSSISPASSVSSSHWMDPVQALQHIKIEGKGSFVPYYEETKPFQMSDFYKYSSKHRQKVLTHQQPPATTKTKTTRQLQEDVKRNSLKYSTCDDQKIQNSMKIIEKSGHKLIEATAKAIAVNPGLAERINSILPHHTGEKY